MAPYFVDIHAHLNFSDFNEDREDVIKKTLEKSVWFINVGADLKTSKESVALSERYGGVFASVGCHPHYCREKFDEKEYAALARQDKVVAIGECGLDYFKMEGGEDEKTAQKELFQKQIALSLEVNKPLMIHCRDAHDDVIEILSGFKKQVPELRGNVHFFTGSVKDMGRYLDLGFTISFTGVITFSRQYDKVMETVPFNRIMVETDSPFAAPLPYRGKRCEPLYTEEVVKQIAEIRGISFEETLRVTSDNAVKFFDLK